MKVKINTLFKHLSPKTLAQVRSELMEILANGIVNENISGDEMIEIAHINKHINDNFADKIKENEDMSQEDIRQLKLYKLMQEMLNNNKNIETKPEKESIVSRILGIAVYIAQRWIK